MPFKRHGQTVVITADLIIGAGDEAITIPAASLQDADTRAQYDIAWEDDAQIADERFYWNGDVARPKDMPDLRKSAIAEVKRIRQVSLDTFPKSSGVSEVYSENLKAAQAIAAGQGATTTMRDGTTTAEAYLAAMSAGMGITAAQFAAYVLQENTAAAVKAREIEAEYVRLAYTFIPACSFDEVKAVVMNFADFCAARTA